MGFTCTRLVFWVCALSSVAAAAQVPGLRSDSVQVNVNAAGKNIVGDAANEPSLCMDPTNPNRMAIARSDNGMNRHIIVTDEYAGRGIAVQLFATGTPEFPYPLVAPRDSHFRTLETIDMVATYRFQDVADQYQLRALPILRFHLLLHQRLTRFDIHSTDQDIARRNCSEIEDVVVFLHCTSNPNFGDSPFPPAMANSLLNKVRVWIRHAGINNHTTTPEELQMWRNLGVALTDADYWAQYYY